MLGFLKRFLGDNNDQYIAAYQKVVEKINALEPEMQGLTDAKLTGKTDEFRERLAKGETLDDILPEAFAVVREGSRRVLGMRHFDVQLIGGMCLHDGRIAEMRTTTSRSATASGWGGSTAFSGSPSASSRTIWISPSASSPMAAT